MTVQLTDMPGARMSYWIATVLQDARKHAGISEQNMAVSLGVNARTIRRLESGQTMGRDIDHFVAAYAHVCGLEDGRDLWGRAVERWRSDGTPPQFVVTEGPAAAFAEAIRAEALRRSSQSSQSSQSNRPGASGTSGRKRASQ